MKALNQPQKSHSRFGTTKNEMKIGPTRTQTASETSPNAITPTLFDIYECAINPDLLKSRIEEGERAMQTTFVLVEIDTYVAHPNLDHYQWEQDEAASNMKAPASEELQRYLDQNQISYDLMSQTGPTEIRDVRKRAQFAAVK